MDCAWDPARVNIGVPRRVIAYWRSTNECDHNTGVPANPIKRSFMQYG